MPSIGTACGHDPDWWRTVMVKGRPFASSIATLLTGVLSSCSVSSRGTRSYLSPFSTSSRSHNDGILPSVAGFQYYLALKAFILGRAFSRSGDRATGWVGGTASLGSAGTLTELVIMSQHLLILHTFFLLRRCSCPLTLKGPISIRLSRKIQWSMVRYRSVCIKRG